MKNAALLVAISLSLGCTASPHPRLDARRAPTVSASAHRGDEVEAPRPLSSAQFEIMSIAARPTVKARRERAAPALRCSLPLGELQELGAASPPSKNRDWLFSIDSKENGYHFVLRDDLLAEVAIGDFRLFSYGPRGSNAKDGVYDPATEVHCGGSGRARAAKVRGMHMRTWSDERVSFAEYDTAFDESTCRGSPIAVKTVEAQAVWPSVVYAFISTDRVAGKRRVVLLAPAASWVAAPLSPHDQVRPEVGSFTYVAVPLEQGLTKSVALELSERELTAFHGGEPSTAAASSTSASRSAPIARVVVDVESEGVTATVEVLEPSASLDDRMKGAAGEGSAGSGAHGSCVSLE